MGLAKKWYRQGREHAEAASSDLLWAQSEVGQAAVLYGLGQLREAEFSATRALEIFDENEHLPGMSLAIATWSNSLRHQGRLSTALEVLAAAAPILRAAETPAFYLRILIAMARCEMTLGRLGRAQECLDELDAMTRPGEHLHLRLHVDLVRAAVLLQSGQGLRAVDGLMQSVQNATGAGLFIEAEVGRSYLGEALWESQPTLALGYFEQARERLIQFGHVPALLESCRGYARVARTQTRPDEIFGVVGEVLSKQPAELARLEWAVSDGLYMAANERSAESSWRNAKQLLEGMMEQLNEIDRASLTLHPWSRWVREGMAAQS
jgi:tetratricopeptide (TPR) repeat protein